MGIFSHIDTSASALTANRLRMDIISSNIANANTTRGTLIDGEWQPYQRKMVVLEPKESFDHVLRQSMGDRSESFPTGGVKVSQIVNDQSPFKRVYQPEHPDADGEGYVQLPNVDVLKEMVDLIAATRAYEANVTVLNAGKSLAMKALEIGR